MAFGGILPGEQDIERIASWITAENLQDAAKKYLNTEDFVTVFQVPEK